MSVVLALPTGPLVWLVLPLVVLAPAAFMLGFLSIWRRPATSKWFARMRPNARTRKAGLHFEINSNTIRADVLPELIVGTTMTVKGQVTIPKKVRDALHLSPGDDVEFSVNGQGEVVVSKAGRAATKKSPRVVRDRFEAARGKAQVRWRTDELMALLRDHE
jgi:AbrB family looped-hinge helix DNA binding protein